MKRKVLRTDYPVKKIAENTYMISDFGFANCYLLVGEQKALLIEITQYLKEKYAFVRNCLSAKEKIEYFIYTKMRFLYLIYIDSIETVKALGGKK